MADLESRDVVEPARESLREGGRHVLADQDDQGRLFWKLFEELLERGRAASGCPHRDDQRLAAIPSLERGWRAGNRLLGSDGANLVGQLLPKQLGALVAPTLGTGEKIESAQLQGPEDLVALRFRRQDNDRVRAAGMQRFDDPVRFVGSERKIHHDDFRTPHRQPGERVSALVRRRDDIERRASLEQTGDMASLRLHGEDLDARSFSFSLTQGTDSGRR
jgi:hypothetical protein